ncbi:MAG: hypothetical protein ACRDJ3_10130 [Solirubrobacteraceae bacterium]
MRIGYFLSSEAFGPRELVRQAGLAEQGFFEVYANEILPRFTDSEGSTSALTSVTL